MFDRVDSQLVPGLQVFMQVFGDPVGDLVDITARRAQLTQMVREQNAQLPPVPGVATDDLLVAGPEHAPDVAIRVYRPLGAADLPVLLWIHGGGFVMGTMDQDDWSAKLMVQSIGCAVVLVEYRLAPENPYPAPLEDCYAALTWIHKNANAFHFDSKRIAIGGPSGGGGLAAGLALLARDRGEVPVKFQMLVYPMIDDRNIAPAGVDAPDTLVWNRKNNQFGWRSYLGGAPGCTPGGADVSPYAAPFRSADLCGLPPTYMAVGELDLFVQENVEYARRLLAAQVPTEFHVYSGAYHGFDGFAPDADVTRRFIAERDSALKRAFASP